MDYKRVTGYFFTDSVHRKGIKNLIRDIHDKDPKYILLNDTSATAWGLVLKEAWKKAYPSEKLPKFFRVDPRSLENIPNSEKSRQAWKEYLERRGMKETDKIINLDEEYAGGGSENKVREAFENESGLYGPQHFKNIEYLYFDAGWMARENGKLVSPTDPIVLQDMKAKEWGGSCQLGFKRYRISGGVGATESYTDENGVSHQSTTNFRIAKKSKKPVLEPLKFTGDLVRHPSEEYKEIYLEVKTSGREIGEELHAELEQEKHKHKSLEQLASSATAVLAFIGSFFFTSSILTGNVIGTLSVGTTNLIGIILFLIGIVGAFFYIKRYKNN